MSEYHSDNLFLVSAPGPCPAVRLEFGRAAVGLAELSNMDAGRVIELDCRCDDPIAVRAGGTIVARGQAVVIDGRIGVRIEELISPGESPEEA